MPWIWEECWRVPSTGETLKKRLKSVLSGLSQEEKPIVYLDEIHNIVGAGAVGEGSLDASNLLKPYLASGRIRFIGATTHEEYKRYFEKSRSLARRFQNVEIAEPGEDEAAEIAFRGLKRAMRSTTECLTRMV